MTQPKSQPTSQPTTKPKALRRSLDGPEDKTQEGNYQPMMKNLSAMPTGKCDLSTHLGITIRWGAPPPGYLPVAIGGGPTRRLASGQLRPARCAGGVAC